MVKGYAVVPAKGLGKYPAAKEVVEIRIPELLELRVLGVEAQKPRFGVSPDSISPHVGQSHPLEHGS